MAVTLNLLAPSATPYAQFEAKSGTVYTADAFGVVKTVALADISDLLASGCITLGVVGAKSNLAATTAPAATNDSTQDYAVGSRWLDTTNKNEFVCVDATATAAVWVQTPTPSVVNASAATLTVTAAAHAGKVVTLNRAAGIAVTLPAATGTGARYDFVIGTTVTSNTTTITRAGSDTMAGNARQTGAAGAATAFNTASGTVVTLNGSTLGGFVGDRVVLTDIAAAVWQVEVSSKITGTAATPFS
jgi:hypothetical protein